MKKSADFFDIYIFSLHATLFWAPPSHGYMSNFPAVETPILKFSPLILLVLQLASHHDQIFYIYAIGPSTFATLLDAGQVYNKKLGHLNE